MMRHPIRLCRPALTLAVIGLGVAAMSPGRAAAQKSDPTQQIAEIKQQLADLERKLTKLQQSEDAPAGSRPLTIADALTWDRIGRTSLSRDGGWFAYWAGPAEGKGKLTVRQTRGDEKHAFEPGEGNVGQMDFSHDGKWFAFSFTPERASSGSDEESKGPPSPGGRGGPPSSQTAKVTLLNLETGDKQEFEGISRFDFSGESSTHIALRKSPASAPVGPPAPTAGRGRPGRPSSGSSERSRGADLILRDLASGDELTLGNVSDFGFNKLGRWLALAIDSQGQIGNGVQLRDMESGVLKQLDSGKATYQDLTWTEEGDGLTVLKGVEDKKYEDKLYSVLGFTNFGASPLKKVVYDPTGDEDFPEGMTVSPNRAPTFAEDLSAIYFGIHEAEKKDDDEKGDAKKKDEDAEEGGDESEKPKKSARSRGKETLGQKKAKEKPDLVIWHWKDERLQSMQQVQASRDERFSYLCVYRIGDEKFIRLADDELREVRVAPKDRWAVGTDDRKHERLGNLDGRRFEDVYAIDLKTGERKLALEKVRWSFGPSPTGARMLYYRDGHFHTYEMATGKSVNITEGVPVSFVDDEDDHNVEKPPARRLGWTEDGKFALLSDNWDVWKVPADGEGDAVNLTGNGRAEGIRYQSITTLDPDAEGIDLSKPAYLTAYGEWTKKNGFTRLDPEGKLTRLCWDDASFGGLRKADEADVFLYTRQTYKDYPNYYVAGSGFDDPEQLTAVEGQQHGANWSSGVKLIDYQSDKGDKLQGVLYLPADYSESKSYPTVVYIYEKLSNRMHSYGPPSASGFNASVYTSNGYAVLMPDITYTVNDPGMSAVWCVLPALKAAIDTGIVDGERVGLHGHSWGGYQTAFLITQTDAFKAAVAGAPLTNLVSMYSSIYWNSGSANQPIFESSQGRFTGGYWENMDAYTRNSPVFFAPKVTTPLLLLHNDEDGAVDWNQGIEYYNTLRRLDKPVVMLQYKGENHGLRKPANQRDYAVRMREFFDYHLMGKPAPKWLKEGVAHLEMDEHIDDRAKMMEKLIDGKETLPSPKVIGAGGGR